MNWEIRKGEVRDCRGIRRKGDEGRYRMEEKWNGARGRGDDMSAYLFWWQGLFHGRAASVVNLGEEEEMDKWIG